MENFFPLDVKKFITIHPNSKYSSKCYDYWQEVVDLIHKPLKDNGIDIVQIGTKDDVPLNHCLHSHGTTNINQTAYIISKSTLHLGVDSFPSHVASGFGKKIVCLYSNTYAGIARPYWTKDEDCVLFEPDRSKVKPSYSAEENPKSINEINPEDIAGSVLGLLDIEFNKEFTSVRKGQFYNAQTIQLVPDCVVNVKALNVDSIIVRMDLNHNEEALVAQLKNTKCSIVTEDPINLDILKTFKENIKEFVYFVEKNHNPDFVDKVSKIGFPVVLMSEMSDEDIEKIKLYYMDYGVIQKSPIPSEEEIKEIQSHPSDSLYYKSKRVIISQGKFFHSEAAWKAGQESKNIHPQFNPVVSDKDFWESMDEYYIFQKTS